MISGEREGIFNAGMLSGVSSFFFLSFFFFFFFFLNFIRSRYDNSHLRSVTSIGVLCGVDLLMNMVMMIVCNTSGAYLQHVLSY